MPGRRGEAQSRSTLKTFGSVSGALKLSDDLPRSDALCNDMAVAADGTVYLTDRINREIDRHQGGDQNLTMWAGDGELGQRGGILDGIALGGNRVLVNTGVTGRRLAVAIGADGAPAGVRKRAIGRSLERPDGMRSTDDT